MNTYPFVSIIISSTIDDFNTITTTTMMTETAGVSTGIGSIVVSSFSTSNPFYSSTSTHHQLLLPVSSFSTSPFTVVMTETAPATSTSTFKPQHLAELQQSSTRQIDIAVNKIN